MTALICLLLLIFVDVLPATVLTSNSHLGNSQGKEVLLSIEFMKVLLVSTVRTAWAVGVSGFVAVTLSGTKMQVGRPKASTRH